MAVSCMRNEKYAILPLLWEQIGHCGLNGAMEQSPRSTERISSVVKNAP